MWGKCREGLTPETAIAKFHNCGGKEGHQCDNGQANATGLFLSLSRGVHIVGLFAEHASA